MVSHSKKLSKQELKREPAFNVWLRGIQHQVEDMGGNVIKLGLGVLIAVVVIGGGYAFYSSNRAKGEAAFAKALKIYQAEVQDPKAPNPTPPAPGKVIYQDEQKKYTEAATAFEQAAAYSAQRELSRYYVGLCRLKLDAPKGQQELRALCTGDGQINQMARIALADSFASSGQTDEAVKLYLELQGIWEKNRGVGVILPPEAIQFSIAKLYDAQGKTAEAVQAYTKVITTNRSSRLAMESYGRLSALDPESARKMTPPKMNEEAV